MTLPDAEQVFRDLAAFYQERLDLLVDGEARLSRSIMETTPAVWLMPPEAPWSNPPGPHKEGPAMIILGVILLILGFVFGIPILWTIGIILIVAGAVLTILGATGRAIGGRKTWY